MFTCEVMAVAPLALRPYTRPGALCVLYGTTPFYGSVGLIVGYSSSHAKCHRDLFGSALLVLGLWLLKCCSYTNLLVFSFEDGGKPCAFN